MTKEEKFEQRLNSLILLKTLLIHEGSFDEVTQREYCEAWNRAFELLNCDIIKV